MKTKTLAIASAFAAFMMVAGPAVAQNAPDAAALLREHLRNYPGHSTVGGALYFLGRRYEASGDRSSA